MKLLILSLVLFLFCFYTIASPKREIPKKSNMAILEESHTHPLGKVHLVDKAGEKQLYLLLFKGGLCKLQWVEGNRNCVDFLSLGEVLKEKNCLLSFSGENPACRKEIYSHQIKRDYSF